MPFERIIDCPRCGSKFELYKSKIPTRDKDSDECDVCGYILIEWNGGVMYRTKLIEKHENHKSK